MFTRSTLYTYCTWFYGPANLYASFAAKFLSRNTRFYGAARSIFRQHDFGFVQYEYLRFQSIVDEVFKSCWMFSGCCCLQVSRYICTYCTSLANLCTASWDGANANAGIIRNRTEFSSSAEYTSCSPITKLSFLLAFCNEVWNFNSLKC